MREQNVYAQQQALFDMYTRPAHGGGAREQSVYA